MAGAGDEHGGDRAGHDWDADADQPLETERLELADDEERLPWLESPDDDDDDDYAGADSGKLIGLVLLGLVALAAIVGGIWWATHRAPDPAQVADGSVIPAPQGPYKEAPRDPGGKTFDGTGDSSFAVSEGQNREAKLGAGAGTAPAPIAPAPAPSAAPAAAATAAPAAASVGVQVGAFSSQAAAEAGWTRLVTQANGALAGVSHRVIAGSADIGTVYRLQAVAGNAAAANALCGRLKASGISCQVK